jgi:4-amino-4-deoxy-L-arabinose transferase-like glycosyltransferase
MTRRALRIILAFLFALLFLGEGITAPFHIDEEAESGEIVLSIVNSDDWLTPVDLEGQLIRKPPLFYWLTAIIAKIRGRVVDEAGVRAVSLLAAAGVAAVVMELASAFFGIISGFLAYLFLLGSYGFAARAAFARIDMLFTFLVFMGYSLFYPLTAGKQSLCQTSLVGVLLGLGILTKGPLALVLCLVALIIYYSATGRHPVWSLLNRQNWAILLIAVILAAAWYIPAFLRAPELFRIQLLEENLGHFLPARLGGTGEAARPFYYIWLRFLTATLPLNIYLAAVLPRIVQERKRGDMLLYQSAFIVGSLGFFSISSAKRDDYILVVLPSFAVVIGGLFSSAAPASSGRLRRIADLVVACLLVGFGIVGLIAIRYPFIFSRLSAKADSSVATYATLLSTPDHSLRISATMLLIVFSSLAGLYLAGRQRAHSATLFIAIAQLAAISLWVGVLTPALARERTLKRFVLNARRIVANHRVMIVGIPDYEVSYYFGRGIPLLPKDLRAANQRGNPDYLFVWSDQLEQLRRIDSSLPVAVVSVSQETSGHRRMLLLSVDRGARIKSHASCS